ncbi:MAG: hypothetical protein GY940_32860 [bacterium]|nr:hypothetical protein [bacterium]
MEKRGIDVYLPGESDKEYNVKDLLGTVRAGETTEEKILKLLEKFWNEENKEESVAEKLNGVVSLRPNILGVGIDLNKIFDKFLKKKGKKKKKRKAYFPVVY